MTTAEEYKELGSKAFKSGKYEEAISEWTKGIAASNSSDKNLLKTLYSNRSAAYAILRQYTNALTDGEKCISLDSTWAKAYLRKGDALFSLYRYTEAFNAYNSAARYASPEEREGVQKKVEQAMRAIRDQDDSTSGQSQSSNSNAQGSPLMMHIQKYLRICIFICLLVYVLPIGRANNYMAARFLSICAIVVRGIIVYLNHGIPRFSMDYATRIFNDSNGMGLFLGFIILMSNKPYLLALMSIVIAESVYFVNDIAQYGRANMPMLQQQLAPLLAKYGQSLLRGNDPGRVLSDLFHQRNVSVIATQLVNASAYSEVLQGIFVVVELILPSRNFMFTMLWWQYLQMRYMMDKSGEVKIAFRSVDQQILGLLSNRLCPPILRSLYDQLKSYLAKRVEVNANGAGQGGLSSALSSCTIM